MKHEMGAPKEAVERKPETAIENFEELDVKELGVHLTQMWKQTLKNREALTELIAEATEDPSRMEEIEKLRKTIKADRERFLLMSGPFLEKLSQTTPGMVYDQYGKISDVLSHMQNALGLRLKEESPKDGWDRKSYNFDELSSRLRGAEALVKSREIWVPGFERELDAEIIKEQSRVIDKTPLEETDIRIMALKKDLYERARDNRRVPDELKRHLRPLSP